MKKRERETVRDTYENIRKGNIGKPKIYLHDR